MEPNKAKKILIVEDDLFLRDFYHELLSSEGHQVHAAQDGKKGLEQASAGGWDLILLDIMLPQIDGLAILTELKAHPPSTPNGPIVVLTNLGNESVVTKAFEQGATGFLIKSAMNPDEVLSEIHAYLNKPAATAQ